MTSLTYDVDGVSVRSRRDALAVRQHCVVLAQKAFTSGARDHIVTRIPRLQRVKGELYVRDIIQSRVVLRHDLENGVHTITGRLNDVVLAKAATTEFL